MWGIASQVIWNVLVWGCAAVVIAGLTAATTLVVGCIAWVVANVLHMQWTVSAPHKS